MNKDQHKGAFQKAKGKVKEVTGDVTGNRSMEAKGKVEQAGGTVRKEYGDLKEKYREDDDR